VVVVIVVAGAGVGAYFWYQSQNTAPPPTRYVGLIPDIFPVFTAHGTTNGTGGCSGPGPGETEYCYPFDLINAPGGLLLGPDASDGSVIYETTADASFLLLLPYSTVNATFVNVTLLNEAGRILATFSPGSGWSAFGGDALPIILGSNETGVLNVGPNSAIGDTFEFAQGEWGMTSIQIP